MLVQDGRRTISTSGRVGRWLIASQIALCLVLVIDAGLLVRTFAELRNMSPGFTTEGVVAARLTPRQRALGESPDVGPYFPNLLTELSLRPACKMPARAGSSLGLDHRWLSSSHRCPRCRARTLLRHSMLCRRDFFGSSESRCSRDETSAGVMIIALSPWRSSAVRWRDGSLETVMLSDSTSGLACFRTDNAST